MHDGALVAGKHLYAYVMGEGERWWKVEDHECTEVSSFSPYPPAVMLKFYRSLGKLSRKTKQGYTWMAVHTACKSDLSWTNESKLNSDTGCMREKVQDRLNLKLRRQTIPLRYLPLLPRPQKARRRSRKAEDSRNRRMLR